MDLRIRPIRDDDTEPVVQLSLLAWAPVFASLESILGARLFPVMYPDWRASQSAAVAAVCKDEKTNVCVAEVDGRVVGFLAYDLNPKDESGEVKFLAVHPDYQNRGIGTELNRYALRKMQEAGIKLAIVETGGDPSHAPARRSYEKAGYTGLPVVRYFQRL